MNYVYPKLSEHDLGVVRIGGAGLGNILFTYARALVYARDHEVQLIWPTWPSIKIGPILRREKDKRFYADLFQNNEGAVGGLRRLWLLMRCPHIPEADKELLEEREDVIVDFEGFEGCFSDILYDYAFVRENIQGILKDKNRKVLEFDFGDSIGIHVRLGDFARVSEKELAEGRHDSALPIRWYVQILRQLREAAGRSLRAYVFSDGNDEELAELLQMPDVERLTFGSSIADILGLSRTKMLIASGSSFSMWARYLGRQSCICYANQIKQKILTPEEDNFELETDGELPEWTKERIREIFDQKS